MAIIACALVIASIFLSGPIGMFLTYVIHPQPSWVDAQTFARNFHFIQTLPFFFGFLLTIGSILLVTSTYKLASEDDRPVMFPSIVFVSIYAALISLNYIFQTTYVPALATHYSPQHDVLISAFSMSNPNSVAWAIEMYGYAFLGLSVLFLVPFFKAGKLGMTIRCLLILNALVSITSAFITSFNLSWVLTGAGYVGFFVWNILYLVIAVLVMVSYRKKYNMS